MNVILVTFKIATMDFSWSYIESAPDILFVHI